MANDVKPTFPCFQMKNNATVGICIWMCFKLIPTNGFQRGTAQLGLRIGETNATLIHREPTYILPPAY